MIYTFPKDFSPKVNVIAKMEFESAYLSDNYYFLWL